MPLALAPSFVEFSKDYLKCPKMSPYAPRTTADYGVLYCPGKRIPSIRNVWDVSYHGGSIMNAYYSRSNAGSIWKITADDKDMLAKVYGNGSTVNGYGPLNYRFAGRPSSLPLFFDDVIYGAELYPDCTSNHGLFMNCVYMDGSVGEQKVDVGWHGSYQGNDDPSTVDWYYPYLRGLGIFP